MRYKAIVTQKIEALDNNISRLSSFYSQNVTREQFLQYINTLREKLEEIQTLINVEQEGI